MKTKNHNQLERIVFLEMRNKQFLKLPDSEYFKALDSLTKQEKEIITLNIFNEIHQIHTSINNIINSNKLVEVYSIEEYNKFIEPVSQIILNVSRKYNLTLKNKISKENEKAIKNLFGEKYLNNLKLNTKQL